MAHSIAQVYLHIVFSTKYRQKIITPEMEKLLYPYMGGIIKNLGGVPIEINGSDDHTHVLATLPRTLTIADYIEKFKGNSSKWIKTQNFDFRNFAWQNGYAAFSVNYKGVEVVGRYIRRQKIHHKKQDFKVELIGFLDEYGVEYDPAYLWD